MDACFRKRGLCRHEQGTRHRISAAVATAAAAAVVAAVVVVAAVFAAVVAAAARVDIRKAD